MKKLSVVLLVTFMSVFSTFSNNDDKVKKEVNTKLRITITNLLGNYKDVINNDVEKASIKFLINKEGEIIVLSVKTDDRILENFIKSKLNYKSALVKNAKVLQTYTLPIKFVKE